MTVREFVRRVEIILAAAGVESSKGVAWLLVRLCAVAFVVLDVATGWIARRLEALAKGGAK